MKKTTLIFFFCLLFLNSVSAQNFAITCDRTNVLYVGLDNPLSLFVENTSATNLVIKCSNGNIRKEYGSYVFSAKEPGVTIVTIYKKEGSHLTKIGEKSFRVKLIPPPSFKIGSGKSKMSITEIQGQQFVRADMDGDFGYDVRYSIVSFTVNIISESPCKCVVINCESNKISDELKSILSLLKPGDMLVFKNIVASGPDGETELNSTIVTVY